MAYTPDQSRATNVPVTVTSGPHVANLTVDQTVERPPGSTVREIGFVQLVAGEESVITVGTAATTGLVILDAIQLILETPDGSLGWSAPGTTSIASDSAGVSATLLGTEAEVTLYWKQGSSAPEQTTGWDGSISEPGVNISPGLVQRTITGLLADTLYSCIYYANNGTVPAEAWSAPVTFATSLTAAQLPVFIGAVAGDSSVALSWQDNASNETGYILQRSTAADGPYATIEYLAPDTTSYVDAAIPALGIYYYRLAATNAGNGSTTDFSAAQTSAEVTTITSPGFIYSETFSDVGALHGSTPDVTTGGATWTASDWEENGTTGTIAVVNSSGEDDSAFLPFTPVTGNVYTLSATMTVPSGGQGTGWAAIGFAATNTTTGSFWANNTAPWILYRPDTNVDSFLGPGTGGSADEGNWATSVTFSIILNTENPAWTAEWFIDDGSGPVSVRSETFGTNPTIGYAGFGRENGNTTAIDNFNLTVNTPGGGNNFTDWIAGNPGVGVQTGLGDDPDVDGIDNGVENFFGTAPDAFSPGLVASAAAGGTFTFTHPINATPATDLTAAYRWSTDLQTFHADGAPNGAGTTTVNFAQGAPSGGMVTVTATITGTLIPDKLFVDVEVTQHSNDLGVVAP